MDTTNVDRLIESINKEVESGFNSAVDLILKQIKGEISEGERKNETNKIECDTVNFIREKLTSALSQARQEGREEAVEYIKANTGLPQAMPSTEGYSIVTDEVLEAALTNHTV